MTDNTPPQTGADSNIEIWINIIALWSFVTSILNLFFYGLVRFSFIQASLSLSDHVNVLANSITGLFIFYGLRGRAPWGWKLAVLSIPCSWIYGVYSIAQDYQPGMGVVAAIFLFIDIAIIIFLFTPALERLFRINSFWHSLAWIKYPLLVTAVFLFSFDFLGNLGGIVSAFIVFSFTMLRTRYVRTYIGKKE